MDDAYEPLVREVAAAWEKAQSEKAALMMQLPSGLYWSIAHLAARWEAEHEQREKR